MKIKSLIPIKPVTFHGNVLLSLSEKEYDMEEDGEWVNITHKVTGKKRSIPLANIADAERE